MSSEQGGERVLRYRWRIVASAVAVLAMCVFIFLMSQAPADESDELSLGLAWHIVSLLVPGYGDMSAAEQMDWQKLLNHPIRKTAHFTEYAALGALMLNMIMQLVRLKMPGSAGEVPEAKTRGRKTEGEPLSALEARGEPGSALETGGKPDSALNAEGEAFGALGSAGDNSQPKGLRSFSRMRSYIVLAWALATFYAATDEVHQIFVPGRAGMVTDVLLDSAGALTGVLICWLLFFRVKPHASAVEPHQK